MRLPIAELGQGGNNDGHEIWMPIMSLPSNSGFTLIELMVTLAVVAILMIIGVPSFETVINSNRLTSAANELVAAIQVARNEAIRFNRRAVVCLSTNPNIGAAPTCAADNATNAIGWIAFVDADRNGTFNAGDKLLRVATVHGAVSILGSSNLGGKVKIFFRSDGLARTAAGAVLSGTVDMCIASKRPRENVRHVSISSGSVSVSRFIANGVCAEPGNNT